MVNVFKIKNFSRNLFQNGLGIQQLLDRLNKTLGRLRQKTTSLNLLINQLPYIGLNPFLYIIFIFHPLSFNLYLERLF